LPSSSILVVDDDFALRQLIQLTLESAGHHVTCAADGRLASRAMALTPAAFDLVITDMLMPERDGLELIEELRRRYPHVRIIAISGGGRIAPEEYLQIAKGLGANGILGKPFFPKQLLAAVDQVLAVENPGA
jgi:two-component system cell cycle response regulator CpdR